MLLQNQEYVKFMNQEIDKVIESTREKNPKEKWEILKTRIKKQSIKFSRNKSSEEKLIISALSEKVNQYEENLPLTENQDIIYENTKKELEEKQLERIAGVYV